ncbi:MAG: hypothetical protein ABJA86_13405 [Nocardioidaceae bacterium]
MRWAEMEQRQPRLAALGQRRLIDPGVLLVATIRGDGTPRLSPVEPFIMAGHLFLSMLWQSRKAADLVRDPRVLVHSIVTSRDGRRVCTSWHVGHQCGEPRAAAGAAGARLSTRQRGSGSMPSIRRENPSTLP